MAGALRWSRAKHHGLTLVTDNVADVRRTGVPVIDPFAAA